MHIKQIEEARSLAIPVPQSQAAVDKSPFMQIQYVPTLGTGGSSASAALVQDSSLTLLVNSSTPAGADVIGVSGIIDTSQSTFSEMGEVVDAFNGALAWRAYLIAALRSDASSILLAKSATICSGDTGLTFYGDTSQNEGSIVPGTAAAKEIIGAAISGERFVNNGINGHLKDADDEVENSLTYAQVQLTFTGSDPNSLNIFTGVQGSAEVLIYTQTLTSTTEQELGISGAVDAPRSGMQAPFITAPRGARLIIRAAASTAFSAVTKFNVSGKSAVLKNDRIVDAINFTA